VSHEASHNGASATEHAATARFDAVVEHVASDWRAYVLAALIALCACVPGLTSMPVMDVDEARFAQASRQMLETGDFVLIRVQDQPRYRKPAGAHWLQAASTAVLQPIAGRDNAIWTYRLPSVLGVVLAVLATLWAGRALLGPVPALLGGVLFGAGLLVGFEGMTARTDALMLGFTTLAVAALARLRFGAGGPRGLALVFWGALGAAVLVKGPIPLMVVGLTIVTLAVWERRAAWLAPLGWWPAIALGLAIVVPWGVAIGIATNGAFYTEAFTQDLAAKVAGRDHRHGGIFGYHLLLLPLLAFPAAFALPAAARLAVARDEDGRQASALRFLIAWIAPTLLVFELSPTKLAHYAMPIYPAVALVCAAGLFAARDKSWRVTSAAGIALFTAMGALLTLVLFLGLRSLEADRDMTLLTTCAVLVIIAIGVAGLLTLRSPSARTGAAVACALALAIVLRGFVLPNLPSVQLSASVAGALTRIGVDETRNIWIVGYDEPSVVFLTRTSTHLTESAVAGTRAEAGDLMVVEQTQLGGVEAALAARRLSFRPIEGPIEGLSMSSNTHLTLIAGEVEPATNHFAAR